MARYDFDTRKFIEEVVGIKKTSAEERPSVLYFYQFLNNHYNRQWTDWEPETLWATLARDHKPPSEGLKNVIMALQVVVKTNFPFEQWHVFEKVGHAFNKNPVSFSIVQPLELNEVAYTLKILKKIRPKMKFDPEVYAYIASIAKNSGVVYLPPGLYGGNSSQKFLDEMNNDMRLKERVRTSWPALPGKEETALNVQLARLNEIKEYV